MRAMNRFHFRWMGGGAFLLLAAAAAAQPADAMLRELAALREDVRGLSQRVGQLELANQDLARENSALQARTSQSYVTLEQLNKAVADLNKAMQSALASQKREVLDTVGDQLAKLGRQTNAALDALAKGQATRPTVQSEFKEDYSKQGVSYTVQTGDTISSIAQKLGARSQDIINANKISDPTKIRVGQTLFIPQGR